MSISKVPLGSQTEHSDFSESPQDDPKANVRSRGIGSRERLDYVGVPLLGTPSAVTRSAVTSRLFSSASSARSSFINTCSTSRVSSSSSSPGVPCPCRDTGALGDSSVSLPLLSVVPGEDSEEPVLLPPPRPTFGRGDLAR